jgi:hypothetical protein
LPSDYYPGENKRKEYHKHISFSTTYAAHVLFLAVQMPSVGQHEVGGAFYFEEPGKKQQKMMAWRHTSGKLNTALASLNPWAVIFITFDCYTTWIYRVFMLPSGY